jgi:hypothetical protein
MKKFLYTAFFLIIFSCRFAHSQTNQDTTVYLITCSPGTETYSIYGHSAIRILIQHLNSDTVYNWGVFDFNTPNFAWKFAKGRLNYLLDTSEFQRFMAEYVYERRSVYLQKINFDPNEKRVFISLIIENRLPQNRSYRYDFFYDDCSTRIRDLIEKAVGSKLSYPPEDKQEIHTFREMVGEFQKSSPWLRVGIDLIMGTPGEVKAKFHDRMFLPLHLQKNLSQAVINREQNLIPLLGSAETILQFDPPVLKSKFYTTPFFVFTLLALCILILTSIFRHSRISKILDLIIFSIFSILSILMIFFNFFTDHEQMRLNLNILWFNPVILICLICLISGKSGQIWFRIVFYLSLIFIPSILIAPHAFNISFLPVIVILILRTSVRCNFKWNPLSVSE